MKTQGQVSRTPDQDVAQLAAKDIAKACGYFSLAEAPYQNRDATILPSPTALDVGLTIWGGVAIADSGW